MITYLDGNGEADVHDYIVRLDTGHEFGFAFMSSIDAEYYITYQFCEVLECDIASFLTLAKHTASILFCGDFIGSFIYSERDMRYRFHRAYGVELRKDPQPIE